MRNLGRMLTVAATAIVVGTGLSSWGEQVQGQAKPDTVSRMKDGKPNFNGIWQVMNTAQLEPRGPSGNEGLSSDLARSERSRQDWASLTGATFPISPRRRRRGWITSRIAGLRIRKPSATCRACLGRPTCPIHSRSFRARARSRSSTALRRPTGRFTWTSRSPNRRPSTAGWADRTASGKATRWSLTCRLQRPGMARSRGQFRQRDAQSRRALHAGRTQHHQLRSDARGSCRLYASVEDQHAALPTHGKERADPRVQVRRVRRRAPTATCAGNERRIRIDVALKRLAHRVALHEHHRRVGCRC